MYKIKTDVYISAYSWRRDKPIYLKLGLPMPWNKQVTKRLKHPNRFLGLSPGEGGFSSSEIKHGAKNKLRREDYRNRATTPKTRLDSSPGEHVSCHLKTNDVWAPIRPRLFRRGDKPEKLS
jgi:hypothetical protein